MHTFARPSLSRMLLLWLACACAFPGLALAQDSPVRVQTWHLPPGPATGATIQQAATSVDRAREALAQTVGYEDARDLAVVSTRQTPHSTHVTLQREIQGVPVWNERVVVNLDPSGTPRLVFSTLSDHQAAQTLDPTPRLSASRAVSQAEAVYGTSMLPHDPALFVKIGSEARLVWQVVVRPEGTAAEWHVLVDAQTGTVVQATDLATHAHAAKGSIQAAASAPSPAETAATPSITSTGHAGSGKVFKPNPISRAGVSYGGAYVDGDDVDTSDLNDQLVPVALQGLSMFADGFYRLHGPHVAITGDPAIGHSSYTPPLEASPEAFTYTRSDDRFEAVNAYYHIDASQRYVESLNVGWASDRGPVRVNPHGLGMQDNSKYFPGQHAIAFGQGGVDDAEDADVVLHEYAHALLEASAPGLLHTAEGRALHEGWADYWAASHARAQVEDGNVSRGDWRTLFEWDSGDGSLWRGRVVEHTGQYPEATRCDDTPVCNIYADGTFWAATLMDVQDVLGRQVADRLSLASHAYLVAPVTFEAAAMALVQAEDDLYNGAYADLLWDVLAWRGLVDGTSAPSATSNETPDEQAQGIALHPGYPNPARQQATLGFTLTHPAPVTLEVYDLLGQRVARLVQEQRTQGTYTVPFEVSDLPSGTYMVRLQAGGIQQTERLVVIR